MENQRAPAIAFLKSAVASEPDMTKLRRALDKALPSTLDAFYEAIEVTSLSDTFSDKSAIEPTKQKQHRHWERLFSEEFERTLETDSKKIGEIHLRQGLTPSNYIAAYGWVMAKIAPKVISHYKFSPKAQSEALSSLIVRFFADMATALSAYEGAVVESSLQEMAQKNTKSLGQLSNSMSQLNNVSYQLALLQRNSQHVAESGETISAAATQLVSSIGEITQTSEDAAHDAQSSSTSAAESQQTVQELSNVISNISSAVSETSHSVNELSEASDDIGQMLSVIEGIAEQTNLLALNATIEAARAGEAGKGFAVVASEVKQLANQTAKSTEDITARINALREGMTAIKTNMQTSNDAVSQSEKAISQTAQQIDQFANQVTTVSFRMTEIAEIMAQQQTACNEIAESIDRVAHLASNNGELVETVSSSMTNSTGAFMANAATMFDSDSPLALCYMAKIDHIMFKKRTIDACMGRDTWAADAVPDHHNCRLGKWYDGLSIPELRNEQAFRDLEAPHAMVHSAAKAALQAAADANKGKMTEHLTEMEDASMEVTSLLDKLATVIEERYLKSPKVA